MKKTVYQLTLIGAFAVCTLTSIPALSEETAAPDAAPPASPVAEAPVLPDAPVPAPAAADTPQTVSVDTPSAATVPTTSSSHEAWLAEVRAQRKAQRDRMAQAREDRQSYYPGSPRNEDMDAYRENMRNRATQYQESMRARRRWMNPRGEYIRDMQEMRRNAMQAQAETRRKQWEQMNQQTEQQMSANPYGWNNPWYFQGY